MRPCDHVDDWGVNEVASDQLPRTDHLRHRHHRHLRHRLHSIHRRCSGMIVLLPPVPFSALCVASEPHVSVSVSAKEGDDYKDWGH